jgi:hypothetical protein
MTGYAIRSNGPIVWCFPMHKDSLERITPNHFKKLSAIALCSLIRGKGLNEGRTSSPRRLVPHSHTIVAGSGDVLRFHSRTARSAVS